MIYGFTIMPKINQRDIVGNLVEIPDKSRRPFWAKEMTLLKKLLSKYPIEFLSVLKFSNKFDSLAVLCAGPLVKELESRYYQWQYISKPPVESIPKDAEKIGEDFIILRKQKTIKDFLNEQS